MTKNILLFVTALSVFCIVNARQFRVFQIPNGNVNQCNNCHNQVPNLNDLGKDVLESLGGNVSGGVDWNAIANLDSDNDGFTNAFELQDLDGSWSEGNPNPGDPSLVTNPGDADDFPTSVNEQIKDIQIIITQDLISIQSLANTDLNMNVSIVSSNGQTIDYGQTGYANAMTQVDLTGLSSGAYYLVVSKNNKVMTRGFSIRK